MELSEILCHCDHTLLSPTATWEEIRGICDDGIRFQTASVCIPASYVAKAKEYVGNKLAICTVIGFPNGYATTAAKCFMAYDAVSHGADEVDMVVNLGWVKDGAWEQITDEIKGVVRLIDEVYQLFGFEYKIELSTRPEDSMGSDEDWEMATEGLKKALDELGRDYVINEGDGAFYGPKIDFHLVDAIGRTWQCGTIQLDFQLPQRFEAEYIGADGEAHRPIMIHRVCFGSIERFIGILTEHFAGKFPTWLAPVQVKVLPISDKYFDYSEKVLEKIKAAGIRALKTLAQTAVATIGTTALFDEVNWVMVASASALAAVLSLLTSVAGLPELAEEKTE